MPQVIKLKRRITGPGNPGTLEPGEMAYNTTGHTLVVGDDTSTVQPLVSPYRQVEVTGAQTITGPKRLAVTDLKLTGGAPNNVLATDGDGNLSFIAAPPPTPATNAEMDAGTLDTVFGTPKNTRALVGASVTTLTTGAKTLVPAINEVKAAVDLLAGGNVFVGSFNATTGTIAWTASSGASGGLPAPGSGNNGWYLIAEVGGSTPPAGAPAGTYSSSDWLISDGVSWTHLAFGGSATATASSVAVAPPVAGGSNVQTALQGLDANKVDLTGDTMTGVLVLSGNPAGPLEAAPKQYVDAANTAQNTVLDGKVDLAGDVMTGILVLAADPAAPLEAATKQYADARVRKAGDTMTGALLLPAAAPVAPEEAANKAYVDSKAGTGGAFTGIVTEPVTFGGTGLAAAPLTLLVVDAGTY